MCLFVVAMCCFLTNASAQFSTPAEKIPEHAEESTTPDEHNERVIPCNSVDALNSKPAPPPSFQKMLGLWAYGFGINKTGAHLQFKPNERRPENKIGRIIAGYRDLSKATRAQKAANEFDVFTLGTKIQMSTAHLGTPPESTSPVLVNYGCVACKSFTQEEADLVVKSYKLAFEYVYYANEVVDFIYDSDSWWSDNMWVDGFNAGLDDTNNGKSMVVSASNWSPRAWFGAYNYYNLWTLHQVCEDLWIRFNNPGLVFFTRGKGCSGHYGYHSPVGRIVLCDDFFNDVANYTEADKPKEMARRIIHEMAHWIETDAGWVADGHDIKKPNSIIRAHGVAEKHYGPAKAKHLAEAHPSFSVRNNDNIAIFMMRLGMAIKSGVLTEFPPGGTDDYPEIPNLPPLPPDPPHGGNDPVPPSGVDKCVDPETHPKPYEIDWDYMRQHCLKMYNPYSEF